MTETEFKAVMFYFRGDLLKYSCVFSLYKIKKSLNFINIYGVHVVAVLQDHVQEHFHLEIFNNLISFSYRSISLSYLVWLESSRSQAAVLRDLLSVLIGPNTEVGKICLRSYSATLSIGD